MVREKGVDYVLSVDPEIHKHRVSEHRCWGDVKSNTQRALTIGWQRIGVRGQQVASTYPLLQVGVVVAVVLIEVDTGCFDFKLKV